MGLARCREELKNNPCEGEVDTQSDGRSSPTEAGTISHTLICINLWMNGAYRHVHVLRLTMHVSKSGVADNIIDIVIIPRKSYRVPSGRPSQGR